MYGNKDSAEFVPSGSFIDLSGESSNLQDLTWIGDGTMEVTFRKNGARYRYYNCPPSLWEFLMSGSTTKDGTKHHSIGAAFHQYVIKMSDIHPYEKIT